MRDRSSRFMFSSAFSESWNVLGSILGKRRSANGKTNSMNGIRINIEKGTSRNKSDVVRSSCFRSLLVNVEPDSVFPNRLRAVRTSAMRSCIRDDSWKACKTTSSQLPTCVFLSQSTYLWSHPIVIKFLPCHIFDFLNLLFSFLRMSDEKPRVSGESQEEVHNHFCQGPGHVECTTNHGLWVNGSQGIQRNICLWFRSWNLCRRGKASLIFRIRGKVGSRFRPLLIDSWVMKR